METKPMFAVATVEPDVPYLTGGKSYPVIAWLGDAFTFLNDDGGKELALVAGCHHLNGAGWTITQ